jgi:ATP-binding protein involved in chromosome partitioning
MTQTPSEAAVLSALRNVHDPDLRKDIVSLGFVKNVQINDGRVSFSIELTTPACPVRDQMKAQAQNEVLEVPGVRDVEVTMTSQVRSSMPQTADLIPYVKNTLAISSGKGGVGKSTVSVNLACALGLTGAKVGLMDADVYGPDIPLMMGTRGRPGMFENRIIPVVSHGIKLISLGFFIKEGDPVVWRGPMVHSAIQQFLRDVEWGELDYLLMDMPPGTGDAQLSLSQIIPLTGAVMVTTPQDVALLDVRKGLTMFRKMNVPILGVVENMSYFVCPHCGERSNIFGEGGGQKIAREMRVPLLAQIPLDPATRKGGDEGMPIVIGTPSSPQAEAFRALAGAVAAQISIHAARKLPVIS